MPWTAIASTTGAGATRAKPTGTQEHDLLVGFIWADPADVNGPTGWARSGDIFTYGSTFTVSLWWKVAGASEPADYTWAGAISSWQTAIATFRGPSSSPVANAAAFQTEAATTEADTPAINIEQVDALVVTFIASQNTATGYTPPAGYTEIRDADGVAAAYRILSGAGPGSTSLRWTAALSDTFGVGLMAFAPASVLSRLPMGLAVERVPAGAATVSRPAGTAAMTVSRPANSAGMSTG